MTPQGRPDFVALGLKRIYANYPPQVSAFTPISLQWKWKLKYLGDSLGGRSRRASRPRRPLALGWRWVRVVRRPPRSALLPLPSAEESWKWKHSKVSLDETVFFPPPLSHERFIFQESDPPHFWTQLWSLFLAVNWGEDISFVERDSYWTNLEALELREILALVDKHNNIKHVGSKGPPDTFPFAMVSCSLPPTSNWKWPRWKGRIQDVGCMCLVQQKPTIPGPCL